MALGFNYSTGGDSSTIVPFIKYDARAGRLFRNDRVEHDGTYLNNNVDITNTFRAIIDLENIEVGYLMFSPGAAPSCLLVPFGEPMPDRPPDDKWKQGVRVMMKLDAKCGGDVREISSNAASFLKGFDALHDQYEKEKHKNRGLLPIVSLKSTQPITTGTGDRKSTNYSPEFEIVGWAARPANLVHVPKNGGDENPYI